MRSIALFTLAVMLLAGGCTSHRSTESSDDAQPAAAPAPSVPAPVTPPAPAPPAKPPLKTAAAKHRPNRPRIRPVVFEDPRHIPAGIAYDDMVRRFGPPTMKITDGPGRFSLSYATKKSRVQVEMKDGKVTSVAAEDTGL